jgi:hypothetical protein
MTRTELVRQSEEVNFTAWGYEQENVPDLTGSNQRRCHVWESEQNMGLEDRRLMEFERVMGKTRWKGKKKMKQCC